MCVRAHIEHWNREAADISIRLHIACGPNADLGQGDPATVYLAVSKVARFALDVKRQAMKLLRCCVRSADLLSSCSSSTSRGAGKKMQSLFTLPLRFGTENNYGLKQTRTSFAVTRRSMLAMKNPSRSQRRRISDATSTCCAVAGPVVVSTNTFRSITSVAGAVAIARVAAAADSELELPYCVAPLIAQRPSSRRAARYMFRDPS